MTLNKHAPLTIIIFGATGDLSRKKLLPALLDLYGKELLPTDTRIVGFARQYKSRTEWQTFVREQLQAKGYSRPTEQIDQFIDRNWYCQGDFTTENSHHDLERFLADLDKQFGVCTNKLLYLAVPPSLYSDIFDFVAASGLEKNCAEENWVRIAVEKPFGSDLQTAQALDKKLCSLFREEQIFRIDHYLGKSPLENITAFRFANNLFESSWDNQSVERINVRLFETIDVASRGAYYDRIGQLRDVGQNHILQMLALATMDDPVTFTAPAVRAAREAVLRRLRLLPGGQCRKGQYQGYRKHDQVDDQSTTDTYFQIEAEIDSDRWRGVPIVLESGKRMTEAVTEVEVVFKAKSSCVCDAVDVAERCNVIRFRIQPDPEISLRVWLRRPGFQMAIESRDIRFPYLDKPNETQPDAYEKILLDTIEGDQTIFTTGGEVEAAWQFIMPILKQWEKVEPELY